MTYSQACKYAWVISRGIDWKELVHNAYIQYWNSKGESLFSAPKPLIIGCIWKALRRRYRENMYVYQNELYPRLFFDYNEEIHGYEDNLPDSELISKEDELIFNSFMADLRRRVDSYETSGYKANHRLSSGVLSKVLSGIESGNAVVDIAESLGITVSSTKYYKKKIKEIAQQMREYQPHNPFNGSNISVTKVIKRETYDKNPDKYSEFKEEAVANEWYQLLVNAEGVGLLIKEDYKESLNRNY